MPGDRAPAITLYELESRLAFLLETEEGGIPPELEQEFRADLARQLEAAVEKRDRVGQFIRHCEAEAAFAKAEAERIRERGERFTRAADRMRLYVKNILEENGQKRLDGKNFTFSVRQNPPSVAVLDETAIPAEFRVVKTEVTVNKLAIRDALKAGAEVAGCELRHSTGLSLR